MDQPEHSYDELSDVVIDVMLKAGEEGMNGFERLLEETASELSGRKDAAGERLSRERGRSLDPRDAELVVDIGWELVRQGVLTVGPNPSNPMSPGLRRSRFGERALRLAPRCSHGKAGFTQALRLDPADMSPDALAYLREAIRAFYMDCLLSTSVMLAVAAEGEFLRLLGAAKSSRAHGARFSRISESLSVTAKIVQFKEAIRPIEPLLPKSATDELDHNLDVIHALIRAARDELGRPSAVPPSRDQAHLYLQVFAPFARQAMRLREALNEPAGPRIVRLH